MRSPLVQVAADAWIDADDVRSIAVDNDKKTVRIATIGAQVELRYPTDGEALDACTRIAKDVNEARSPRRAMNV